MTERADELVGLLGGAKNGCKIMIGSAESGSDEVLCLLLGELSADNSKGSGNLGGGHAGTGRASDRVCRGGNASGEESSSKGLHDDSSSRKYYFSVY